MSIKIIINGINGRLGAAVAALAPKLDIDVAAGADIADRAGNAAVYRSLDEITEEADVIVDCSVHSAAAELLEYAEKRGLPVVIATTGHNEEELALIHGYAERLPVFMSANMSVGINTLIEAAKMAAKAIGGYDIEIVETHHNQKKDAPSGTALMIANAVNEALEPSLPFVFDRSKTREARGREIGIHAVRGGTIPGNHEISFFGDNEVIKISHQALSRDVFAEGVLASVKFMLGKPSGFYGMKDLMAGAGSGK